MAKKKKYRRPTEEINASSMADIAFLLLIFFLVTTTIVNEKGVLFNLPKKTDKENITEELIEEKNMYNIIVNSSNGLLVENELMELKDLRQNTKKFLSNNGKDPNSSDSPQKAVVTLKADRGADFQTYLSVLNELKAAYHELRAEYLDITVEEYLSLDITDPENNALLKEAKKQYPPSISKLDPFDTGN